MNHEFTIVHLNPGSSLALSAAGGGRPKRGVTGPVCQPQQQTTGKATGHHTQEFTDQSSPRYLARRPRICRCSAQQSTVTHKTIHSLPEKHSTAQACLLASTLCHQQMNIPANLFLDGLQFVQFANAAEDLADAEKAAGTGSSANDMAEAAEHMKEAFSEMQHLAYLLHVTNKADAAPNTACFQDTFRAVSGGLRQAAATMQRSTAHAQQWACSALAMSHNATLASTSNMHDLLSLMLLEESGVGAARASGMAQDLKLPWAQSRSASADGGLTARVASRKQKADFLRRMAVRGDSETAGDLAPDPFLWLPQAAAQPHELLFPVLLAPEKLRLASRALRLPVHNSVLPLVDDGDLPEHLSGPVPGGPGLFLLPTLPPCSSAQARPQWAHGPVLSPGTLQGALRALVPLMQAGDALETATQVRAQVVAGEVDGEVALVAHVGLEQEWAKSMNAPFACVPGEGGGALLQPVLTVALARAGSSLSPAPSHSSIPLPGGYVSGVLCSVQEGTVRAAGGLMWHLWALHRPPQLGALRAEQAEIPGVPPPGLVCGAVERWYEGIGATLHLRVSLERSPPDQAQEGEGVCLAEAFLEAALQEGSTAQEVCDAVDAAVVAAQ